MKVVHVLFILLLRDASSESETNINHNINQNINPDDSKVFDIITDPTKNNNVTSTSTLKDDHDTSQPYNFTLYEFEMFENFELTREVRKNETGLIISLKRLRESLEKRKERIGRGLDEDDRFANLLEEISNLTSDFPSPRDFDGALKGLLLLQDTYDFDLGALTKGKLVSR